MNEQDKEAFEKWWKENSIWIKTNLTAHLHHSQEAWQAALEYEGDRFKPINTGLSRELISERERSKKLVDTLQIVSDANCIASEIARRTLKEYHGEETNGEHSA